MTAWAAFSAWRGDQELFARAVRVAIDAIGGEHGGSPSCRIVVTVPGTSPRSLRQPLIDEETFDGPDEFTRGLTRQALRRWTSLAATVEGDGRTAAIEMRRAGAPAERGVTATVEGGGPDVEASTRDRIAASLSRGGFQQTTSEPVLGNRNASGELAAAVADLNARRRRRMLRVAAVVGFVTAAVLTAIGWIVSSAIGDRDGCLGLAFGAASGLSVLAGVICLRDRWFPAVEIATVTPGRRARQVLTRGLSAGAVLSIGLQLLGGLPD